MGIFKATSNLVVLSQRIECQRLVSTINDCSFPKTLVLCTCIHVYMYIGLSLQSLAVTKCMQEVETVQGHDMAVLCSLRTDTRTVASCIPQKLLKRDLLLHV